MPERSDVNWRGCEKDRIPLLSFFTGGGLMDIGFEMAGFRVAWTNEYNPQFADMYGHGFSAWRKNGGKGAEVEISNRKSIADLNAKEVLQEAFGSNCPNYFGVIGGPPCTDFSRGGKMLGFGGSRGQLTKVYLKMVVALSPTFFVMENVPNLFRIKKEKDIFLKLLKHYLEKSGYIIWYKVLSALELGIPQDRERFFVVGVKRTFLKSYVHEGEGRRFPDFLWPKMHEYAGVKKLVWPASIPYGATPKKPDNIPYELTVQHAFTYGGDAEELPNGHEYFVPKSLKFWSRREGDMAGKSFKRLHRYKYSPTAWYGNNEVHLHPWKPRRLSVREALRLQTVPDSYVLPETSTLSAKFKIICNGVPCLMAKKLAESLNTFLESYTMKGKKAK